MGYSDRATLKLHDRDNVVIALRDLPAGTRIQRGSVTLSTAVPTGHKISISALQPGAPVLKYGQIIGQASMGIAPGDHVHSHNLGMGDHKQDYGFASAVAAHPKAQQTAHFQGYQRPDEQVGTRNYLGILTSVNCSGSVARFIAETVERDGWLSDYPNIDGIVPIVHGTGCGMSGTGEGYDTLFRTLSGYARNPNFGAILLIGLGCEVMQIPDLIGRARMKESARFRYMTIQNSGGTRKSVEKGAKLLREMAAEADKAVRRPTPASALMIGMQCGGSDGLSGITANPALGMASDLIVAQGGTTLLSETSEIYGAEHLLTRRAVSREVGKKLIERLDWWENYCARNFAELDNNPSPGNKRGGLTTILERSLGAVSKSGSAPLTDVLRYGERPVQTGLMFMDSPGYDPCSVTGQVASGANLFVFTTGRGSVSATSRHPVSSSLQTQRCTRAWRKIWI